MTAHGLIIELKTIPKLITALQEDKEAMNKVLLTSSWYSDMGKYRPAIKTPGKAI